MTWAAQIYGWSNVAHPPKIQLDSEKSDKDNNVAIYFQFPQRLDP